MTDIEHPGAPGTRSRSSDASVLPEGALFALTAKVPHTFGGLTKAMLQRSCQFATITGRDSTVLTLNWEPDLDDIRASLRERGLLVDGVTILNLWEDLEQAGDEVWKSAPFDPAISHAELDVDDTDVSEIRRRDGTVWVRKRRRNPAEPVEIVRTEILDRDGELMGGWNGLWPLWRWWLGRILPSPSHLIVDSAYVASCLAAAPLPGVPTTLVMHNNHVAGNRHLPYGRIERSRSFIVPRFSHFDAVVTLTEAQRQDMELLDVAENRVHVVPNAFDPPAPTPPDRQRPAGRGIVMSRLTTRKRIPHAVRAVAAASQRVPSVDLTIYGSGPERENIEATIDEHAAPVRLAGHTLDPASEFAASSFMLLTSTREGFPLVLAESMTTGCLPIAYDLAYGPSDIVRDGIDGFVVPIGDVKAMAARIADVATMRRGRLRRMRKKARQRATNFASAAVIPRWGPVLEAAAARAKRRPDGPEPTHAEMTELERVAGLHRELDCRLDATAIDVTWDEHGVAELLLSCTILGTGGRPGRPHVDVELIHRPTGERFQPLPVDVIEDPEPPSADPTTTVRVTLDTTSIGAPADHVLLVLARLGEIDVIDTVGLAEGARDWLPSPVAAPRRPVLVAHPREGLHLVTATPHAAATVTVSADTAELDISALDADAEVGAVEATNLEADSVITADRVGSGKYRLDLTETGLWKFRARIGHRWRDVAWRGPDPVPESSGPLQVRLTPRGYVRLRRE